MNNVAYIHKKFEEQVLLTPHHIALQYESDTLTYEQLNQRANIVARKLILQSVCHEDIVAIICPRSFEMIIGMLAVLKAGAAYLPIDPDYPVDRINYLVEDSNASYLLYHEACEALIPAKAKSISLHDDGSASAAMKENIDAILKPEQLAYVIYTSGSTGFPKGVMIEHRSIMNTLNWRINHYSFSADDIILQLPSYSFDSSVVDIFSALFTGAKIILINTALRYNLKHLGALIEEQGVTHFIVVPSYYKSILSSIPEQLSQMKAVTIAGEHFTIHLVQEHFRELSGVRLFNEYGPTENSVCTACYEFSPHDETVLIGKEIDNVEVHVLDDMGNPVKTGEVGEIYVSGRGLSKGYYRRLEQTKAAFISDSFTKNKLMYRTGDLAVRNPDNNLKYIGRKDRQVKVRGFRIELGEIETRLLCIASVKDACVIAKEDLSGAMHLVAYLVGTNLYIDKIRKTLHETMPEYMVPTSFIELQELPLTLNGKVDVDRLPNPFIKQETGIADGEMSQTLLSRLQKVLNQGLGLVIHLDEMNLDTDIQSAGVDSLKYIHLLVEVEKEFGFEFDYGNLSSQRASTFGELMELIKNNAGTLSY